MRLVRLSLLAASVVVGAAASVVTGAVAPTDAHASVSIAVAYDALVKDADAVGVATPLESKSVWEDGRIYTYTRVKIDQGIAGELGTGADGWVRTMGGVVGKIGQMVDGEPVFTSGKSSLVFLRKFKLGGTWEVSARAQGQYPVVTDETGKIRKVTRSAAVGVLFPPKVLAQKPSEQPGAVAPTTNGASAAAVTKIRLAGEALHDRPLDDAAKDIAETWKRLHPSTAKK
jgi:hypothetical protein